MLLSNNNNNRSRQHKLPIQVAYFIWGTKLPQILLVLVVVILNSIWLDRAMEAV